MPCSAVLEADGQVRQMSSTFLYIMSNIFLFVQIVTRYHVSMMAPYKIMNFT